MQENLEKTTSGGLAHKSESSRGFVFCYTLYNIYATRHIVIIHMHFQKWIILAFLLESQ